MMTLETSILILILLPCLLCFSGYRVLALHYDHSFTAECLAKPLKPQYGGGIVVNPEFNDGFKGWSSFGGAKIEKRESEHGNGFVVALNRNGSHDSLSQKFNLEKGKFYIISAWLQVSHGDANVAAVFKTRTGSLYAGWSIAQAGCWSMLKGGLTVNASGSAALYFESDHPSTDLSVDSISLQPFDQEEWESHRDQSIEKVRKSKVKLRAVDAQGQLLANAKISLKQVASAFPLGSAMSKNILTLPAYQNWFTSRFKYTVFENELKWYINEPTRGKEDYSLADGMLQFVKQHKIKARGHNVIWENPHWLPSWAQSLRPKEFAVAAKRRIFSIMRRYSGQFIHWDVVNENLHFGFLEKTIGPTASTKIFKAAHELDTVGIPFLNEFGTIEDQHDKYASPAKYLSKIRQIRSQGYLGPLGIGLQGHFNTPNLAYVKAALDTLATAKLPIWVTELDVPTHRSQAFYLEQIIRELHSHPAVGGIMIWAPWSPPLCYRMCLTDANFNSLPTGAAVDKILNEWTHRGLVGTTDADGYFETSLFHGDYELKIDHPAVANASQASRFNVARSAETDESIHVQISA